MAHRASAAARMRKTASSRDTTRLPRTWPHDLGDTWSSIRMPARHARKAVSISVVCSVHLLSMPNPKPAGSHKCWHDG
eukprot:357713-Chlamydomonas_euryale.AAC.23